MWIFSQHILKRMGERGCTRSQILHIISDESDVLIVQSPRDQDVDLHFGVADSIFILVVADRTTKILITVRPMRDKEKLEYQREFNHA